MIIWRTFHSVICNPEGTHTHAVGENSSKQSHVHFQLISTGVSRFNCQTALHLASFPWGQSDGRNKEKKILGMAVGFQADIKERIMKSGHKSHRWKAEIMKDQVKLCSWMQSAEPRKPGCSPYGKGRQRAIATDPPTRECRRWKPECSVKVENQTRNSNWHHLTTVTGSASEFLDRFPTLSLSIMAAIF